MKIRPKDGIVVLKVDWDNKESVTKYKRESSFLAAHGYKNILVKAESSYTTVHYSK